MEVLGKGCLFIGPNNFSQFYIQTFCLINQMFECKIVNIFLSISFNIHVNVLGAQKNHHIETVLLSTHNIIKSRHVNKLINI